MVEILEPVIFNDKKLRVVAYCRVSTDSEDQANSYETQFEYYSKKINNEINWEYVGIFHDLGVTGTSMKKRTGFKEMMNQCKMGNVDMVITKSISRFARNKLECLQIIEELKSQDIDIFFEKERLHTMSSDGGVLISLLATLAENTSKSTSTNLKWGIKSRMENGTFRIKVPPYGYYIENGELKIDSYEGAIVRMIFNEYLNGNGCRSISKKLSASNFYTRTGNKKWDSGFIHKVITNPVYEGNLLLQKTVTTSFPYRVIKNNNFSDRYLYEDDHEAIITHEEADKVRNILNRKRKEKNYFRNNTTKKIEYVYSNLIKCGTCGCAFIRQRYMSNQKERIIWKSKEKKTCHIFSINETVLDNMKDELLYRLSYKNSALIHEYKKQLTKYVEFEKENEIKYLNEKINDAYNQFYENSKLDDTVSNKTVSHFNAERLLKSSVVRYEKEINQVILNSRYGDMIRNSDNIITQLRKVKKDNENQIFRKIVKQINFKKPFILEYELINGMKIMMDGEQYDI